VALRGSRLVVLKFLFISAGVFMRSVYN